MRVGVLDVLPESTLEGLTAEDLRLLLNGVGDINVAALVSYTSFNDESGERPERLARFKRWLWAIVDKMTHLERQDLVSPLSSYTTLASTNLQRDDNEEHMSGLYKHMCV